MGKFKSSYINDTIKMQQTASTYKLKKAILDMIDKRNLTDKCYSEMLNYTIDLFESQGLGTDYYGYHNITHELEVTYISLLAMHQDVVHFTEEDTKYLYAAALFHDFDPFKIIDKPHEESILKFISTDRKLHRMIDDAGIDIEIIKILILRTTYPWAGALKENAMEQIQECFERSDRTRGNTELQNHIMDMGRYLSVIDRTSGYVLGDFIKAIKMAKMNAHALAWNPTLIMRRSVVYFEELLNEEAVLLKAVLSVLSKDMRKNFYDTVLSFMKARQEEISIQADHTYENLKLIPTIETASTRDDSEVINALSEIFFELPTPLQFGEEAFESMIRDPQMLLTTLRINSRGGKIVGYAKGGPLEKYNLREEITDENYGRSNTVFLEPIGLRIGYWGLGGGSALRNMFIMQASSRKYKYMTSFALRDVISTRITKENAESVTKFDPERWDYYRISI